MLDGLAAAIGRPLTAADVEPTVGARQRRRQSHRRQTRQRAYTAEVSAWWTNDFDLLLTPAAGEPPALLEELLPPPADRCRSCRGSSASGLTSADSGHTDRRISALTSANAG